MQYKYVNIYPKANIFPIVSRKLNQFNALHLPSKLGWNSLMKFVC